MSDIEMTHEKKSVESLPANSSWGKFFLAMYFVRNYFRFSGRASRKEYWGAPILANVFMFLIILAACRFLRVTERTISLEKIFMARKNEAGCQHCSFGADWR